MGSTIGSGYHHTNKHTQGPCGRDSHPTGSVSFRFRQTYVGHYSGSHQDQEHCTQKFCNKWSHNLSCFFIPPNLAHDLRPYAILPIVA